MTLSLVPPTDPILRTPCASVTDIATQVEPYWRDMLALMKQHNGAGLAAPQVGLGYRFFVTGPEGAELADVVINPIITWHGTWRSEAEEGCLSFPGQRRVIARWHNIVVEYTTLDGRTVKAALRGSTSRLFQHEFCHLDGICIVPPDDTQARHERLANAITKEFS